MPVNMDNMSDVLAAVKQNGDSLKFASEQLRDNHEMVTAAKNWFKKAL
jgi:hypothetical protein